MYSGKCEYRVIDGYGYRIKYFQVQKWFKRVYISRTIDHCYYIGFMLITNILIFVLRKCSYNCFDILSQMR